LLGVDPIGLHRSVIKVKHQPTAPCVSLPPIVGSVKLLFRPRSRTWCRGAEAATQDANINVAACELSIKYRLRIVPEIRGTVCPRRHGLQTQIRVRIYLTPDGI